MVSDADILKDIPEGKPLRIFLPHLGGPNMLRAQCVYRKTTPPQFSLLFKPGVLPVDAINTKQTCILSIDMGGPSISLEAMVKNIVPPQTLEMVVKKSVSHEQMRDFFRVDAVTRVISKSFHTELINGDKEPIAVKGQTVDISGSGILAIFDNEPPDDNLVHLDITIPTVEPETIKICAHHVRIMELDDGRFEVAYHFDDISEEDRDKIIGCCLFIQRKMLQMKVKIRGL